MVLENDALYPRMTVEKNQSLGLKAARTPKAEARRRVAEIAGTRFAERAGVARRQEP
jgi:multiple sugar transport system ATP-binding protein